MHTILLPYYCEAEVVRFERILRHIARLGLPHCNFEFVLASSPITQPSQRLLSVAQQIAPARLFECPTSVVGYPQGPSAMFWDCMHHIDGCAADRVGAADGFVLWMESDMCPVATDWLDRLDAHWEASGDVIVMGNLIPELYRMKRGKFKIRHLFRQREMHWTQWVPFHVNGGACYRRDLIRHISPADLRTGVFDVDIGGVLWNRGGFSDSPALAFSTMDRLEQDLNDSTKALLHGYIQDKDRFIDACIAGSGPTEVVSFPGVTSTTRQTAAIKHAPSDPLLEAILETKDRKRPELHIYQFRGATSTIARAIENPQFKAGQSNRGSTRRAA